MNVYAGSRYFECVGDNYAPDELVDLLYAMHEVGLPLVERWRNRHVERFRVVCEERALQIAVSFRVFEAHTDECLTTRKLSAIR